MLPLTLEGDRLDVVLAFINHMTTDSQVQLDMSVPFLRLPALASALDDPSITDNPILAGSADQMTVGTPMPTVPEMRCVWDSLRPNLEAVMADSATPEDAAAASQTAAEQCVADLE
jgi:arabinogalactan oligomer/maltooligosaccharide transport system substrate-binding protein